MDTLNPWTRMLRCAALVGALASGLAELARLQGWRLRARLQGRGR